MEKHTDRSLPSNPTETEQTIPYISVVIPVYNDPDGVKQTLVSLVDQTYSTNRYEIIVVDNDSTDGTEEQIAEFVTRYPNLVRGVSEDRIQSSYAARNRGIERATGSILAFVDADMWVEETFLEDVATAMSGDTDCLGGNITVPIPTDPSVFEIYSKLFMLDIRKEVEAFGFVPTAALVVRARIVRELGGFDAQMTSTGDVVFGNQVRHAGYDIHFRSTLAMYHPPRSSLRSKLKRDVRIGRGFGQMERRHPEIYLGNHPLDPRDALPPSPARFRAEVKDALARSPGLTTVSFSTFWSLYLIRSLENLVQAINRRVELISGGS